MPNTELRALHPWTLPHLEAPKPTPKAPTKTFVGSGEDVPIDEVELNSLIMESNNYADLFN